jgi:23S rRNA (cytosine1962-C5)-methyltransferase
MRYVTAGEMKELDRRAIEEHGIPAKILMENAGAAVAREAKKAVGKGRAVVFCGYGNNGGDGLAAARRLVKDGCGVTVIFAGKPKSLSPETNYNLEEILKLNINPLFISGIDEIAPTFKKLAPPAAVIDAIFGIGIKGGLDDFFSKLIGEINALGAPIISCDIPSGLDADTGNPLPVAVKAAVTVTFGYPKEGFRNTRSKEYTGKLIVADIGLEPVKGGIGPAYPGKTVILRSGKKGATRPGHPWIFKSQILKTDTAARPGDIVSIHDSGGKFLGRGYYNPRSGIALRILTFKDEPVDATFFKGRIAEALKKRELFLKGVTNAYRAVFSEADSLPGLIIDVYADTAVFQALTLGMDRLKGLAVGAMTEILKPKYIYEKSVSSFRKLEGLKDEARWWGPEGKGLIGIFEGNTKFLVDIINGHKTGFYLDQRKSRLGLEGFCKDRSVLDLFCYTGGFSASAAVFGARHVKGIDIKEEWLELARENSRLNGVSEKTEFMKADAFRALEDILKSGRKFDIIIIDPPSFLKNRDSLASASKGYRALNALAMKTLVDGGILATFSCSYSMPNEVFSDILKKSASDAGKKITILKRCRQDRDHPIVRAIPETEYLKGYFLKVANE